MVYSSSEKLGKQQALHGRCECARKVLRDFLKKNFLRRRLLLPSSTKKDKSLLFGNKRRALQGGND